VNDETTKTKVIILLSIYNGAAFLREQLDSITRQSHQNYLVVVRDDSSTDGCVDIVDEYVHRYPDKFTVLSADNINLGARASFAFLISYYIKNKEALKSEHSSYVMFCDQDDVWDVDKVSKSIEAIHLAEEKCVTEPVLVHSELRVVDKSLKVLSNSLSQYQGLEPLKQCFGRALINSSVTGCTIICNEALIEAAYPIPECAVMHDWWLAIVAKIHGKVIFLVSPLIDYRQHGGNTLGAVRNTSEGKSKLRRVLISVFEPQFHDFSYVIRQTEAVLKRYSNDLSLRQKLCCYLCRGLNVNSAFIQRLLFRILRRL